MVFKVSKGGVRTGNTLRGLNTTRTKRYGRHACLLGYTSLGRRDLNRLIRDGSQSEENQLVTDTLAKTDVLLSLNKQRRWLLPAMMSQMILKGDFNRGAVVSMLEKHKLKRAANCVSLVSNYSSTASIAPKQKKYFTYSLDSVAHDQSKRERRRARVEQLKRLNLPISLKMENKQKRKGNGSGTISTFTSDGIAPKPATTAVGEFDNDKPEYRMEVIYPCPQSCSLTYNPKYTDVTVAEGKMGKMEVKSNVKTQQKGISTHRKRFNTGREIERLHCWEIDDDVSRMWEECHVNEESENPDDFKQSDINSREFAIDMLLVQAQKTTALCIFKKDSCKNKTKKRSRMFSFSEDHQDKSHIVFVEGELDNFDNVIEPKQVNENIATEKLVVDSAGEGQNDISRLEYFRVILPTSETSPDELKRRYGHLYAEASCQPRRFVIDVTDDVTNLLCPTKIYAKERYFSSYLVCVHDGFYDEGLTAYKVTLNSMIVSKMQGISDIVPFAVTSLSEIMNGIACHLLDLKEKNCLDYTEKKICQEVKNDAKFVNSRIKLKVELVDPSGELSKISISEDAENDKQGFPTLLEEMDEDLFCDVCYVTVTSSRIDSSSGTKLTSCGHSLCDECWASHFRTSIKDGKTTMSCAGYDCSTKVGPITLMSILNVSEVALLIQRQTEEEIETMESAKWCPYPECGRIIKIDSKSNDLCVDVNCACGHKICFSCLGPAHWPAKCDQAEEYLTKLPELTPLKEYVEETSRPNPVLVDKKTKKPAVVRVEGRLCPRCNRFIEKNGGCPHMVCKCGHQMCWVCMKPYHNHVCKPDFSFIAKHTRTLIVLHATYRQSVTEDPSQINSEPPKIQRNKQKASLYQQALQQREEEDGAKKYNKSSQLSPLISKMAKEAQRDIQFQREILNIVLKHSSKVEDKTLTHAQICHYVKSFIGTAVEMKRELHHVTEYTYILLQGVPHSVAKQRILKLANDLRGYCSFVTSILDLQGNQDAKVAFRKLVDLQGWAERALDALIRATRSLRVVE